MSNRANRFLGHPEIGLILETVQVPLSLFTVSHWRQASCPFSKSCRVNWTLLGCQGLGDSDTVPFEERILMRTSRRVKILRRP
jgi:hypothetical protein